MTTDSVRRDALLAAGGILLAQSERGYSENAPDMGTFLQRPARWLARVMEAVVRESVGGR